MSRPRLPDPNPSGQSQTVTPPSTLQVPAPSPLPARWTAALVRFDLDESQAPPRRIATLQVSGPGGQVIQARASCPDMQLWGLTPGQIALYLWPQIQDYVLSSINDIVTRSPSPPEAPNMNVPVTF